MKRLNRDMPKGNEKTGEQKKNIRDEILRFHRIFTFWVRVRVRVSEVDKAHLTIILGVTQHPKRLYWPKGAA